MGPALTAQRVTQDVDVLARAGLDLADFMSEALASLNRALHWDAACTATVDPSTLLITGTLKFGNLAGRDEHDHEWGLIEYGTAEPTAFAEIARRAVPAVATRAHDPGSDRLNRFMRDSYGYGDELRVVLRDNGQVWGSLALFRDGADGRFGHEDVALAASLSEHFARGVRTGLLTGLTAPAFEAALGPAVIIVGSDDQIQMVSAGAEERLAHLMTSLTGTAPTAVVAGLVGSARRYAAGLVARPPRCRVRASSGMWLVLHASPMTTRDGSVGNVVVTIDEARPPEIVPLVVAAFGLTPRERDVTELVLQGLDTKEIAGQMHLSTYTVQDHLKSVFTKADVRSRRELISRIYFDQYVPRLGTDVGPSGWFAQPALG